MSDNEAHDLYLQIEEHFNELRANHADFTNKDNKSAGVRARKAAGEIKKLITPYRKASVDRSKEI